MSGTQQFCTFSVGDRYFGVEVEKVQEVLRFQQLTRAPLAPRVIEGLINLRGEIVTAIDMRHRLRLPKRTENARPMNVVLRNDDGTVSLLVDEIGDVLEVREDSFEPPPDTLDATARELVRGIHKLKDRLLLVLDTQRAVTAQGTDGGPSTREE